MYGAHALMRSLAVLRPYWDGRQLALPDDISPLVQNAYGTEAPAVPDSWAEAMESALAEHEQVVAKQRRQAQAFRIDEVRKPGRSLIGWIDAGVGDADDTRSGRAQVRDGEESLEVLVIQRRSDGTYAALPWLGRGRGGSTSRWTPCRLPVLPGRRLPAR